MSSLSYLDEHLAWQQRVQKEVTIASNFIKYFICSIIDRPYKLSKPVSSLIEKTAVPKNSMFKTIKVPKFSDSLMSTNVYAEVRGKYSRAPALNVKPLSQTNRLETFLHNSSAKNSRRTSESHPNRSAYRRNSAQDTLNSEVVDNDIKELTRLLKIERIKRLIVQKKLENRDNY